MAQSIGSAQSVARNGRPEVSRTASSRRCRGEMPSGVNVSEKAMIAHCRSVAAVTSAIAAAASRGVKPRTPATLPMPIEPDTSSPSTSRLSVGSTALKAA